MTATDVARLQKHLELLKKELRDLQQKYFELDEKYKVLCSSTKSENSENDFAFKIIEAVASLYGSNVGSDVEVRLVDGSVLRAHKFVLVASGIAISYLTNNDSYVLDFTEFSVPLAHSLLRWCYTNKLDKNCITTFLLELLRVAYKRKMTNLVSKCEDLLLCHVAVDNCISLFAVARETLCKKLSDFSIELINDNWTHFSSSDFVDVSADVLHDIIKERSKFPIHDAIRLCRDDVLLLLLVQCSVKEPEMLSGTDQSGKLPLDLALSFKRTDMAQNIISYGVDIDAVDLFGRTTLHNAIERAEKDNCCLLIDNGANVNRRFPKMEQTPLHILLECTAKNKDLPQDEMNDFVRVVSQKLLDCHVDVNAKDSNGLSALHHAILLDNLFMVDLLLKQPANDLELLTLDGKSPLFLSLQVAHDLKLPVTDDGIPACLIKKGANVDFRDEKNGNSLLHWCCLESDEETFTFLLRFSAQLDSKNSQGYTPLHLATKVGLTRTMSSLLSRRVDPNIRVGFQVNNQTGGPFEDEDGTNPFAEDDANCSPPETFGSREELAEGGSCLHLAVLFEQISSLRVLLTYHDDETKSIPTAPDLYLFNNQNLIPLMLSVNRDLEEFSQVLVEAGCSVNCCTVEGVPLLLDSLQRADERAANFYIRNGASFHERTSDGFTPLQLAIMKGFKDIVIFMCENGCDVNEVYVDGTPPLWIALNDGEEDISYILVKYGANLDMWLSGPGPCLHTMLFRAILDSNEAIACFLIKAGCQVNIVRRPEVKVESGDVARDNMTPLHLCCVLGLGMTARMLCDFNADVNAQNACGNTSVHLAIMEEQEELVTLLLHNEHISFSLRNNEGATVFMTAMQRGNTFAAGIIVRKFPYAVEQRDGHGFGLLHSAALKGDLESVLFFINIEADLNSPVNEPLGRTAIFLAIESGSNVVVRNLILAGSQLEICLSDGRTVLHEACRMGNADIVSALLESNVDMEARDISGNTAFHTACRHSRKEVVHLLLTETSVNIHCVNSCGQTPLHAYAAHTTDKDADIAEELLNNLSPTFSLDTKDGSGNSALLLAYQNGRSDLCRLLVSRGASLGVTNDESISVFNASCGTKRLLSVVLDALQSEPSWINGDSCQECRLKLGITNRRHHCRHCGRIVCTKCSEHRTAIVKYDIRKPVRVCSVCFDFLGSAPVNPFF